jgi:Transglycosylase SLT domain
LLLLNPAVERLNVRLNRRLKAASDAVATSATVFCRDVGHGMLVIGHNALAVVGIATVAVGALCLGNDNLRHSLETSAHQWLQERSESRALASGDTLQGWAEPSAVDRATAADIKELPHQQARLAQWISRRYHVAPEPVSALVREAWETGQRARLDPTLILAVMAIESRFNPFAHSPVGAQGLMQVLTRVHDDKYESFGGIYAAFDPVSNLRVGVQVLKESIARGGSVEEGLRHYVGAALREDDGGYTSKILSEQGHMKAVVGGRSVPFNAGNSAVPIPRALPAAAQPNAVQPLPPTPSPAHNDTKSKPAESAEQLALAR